MNCPRCHKGSVKAGYMVCGWCLDEVIFDGDTKRLKGRGYDLSNTRAFALSLDPGVPSMRTRPAAPVADTVWDPGIS